MIKSKKLVFIPVMFCFFAMGFVDLVGIASNYMKADFNLSDAKANIFPSLVFFWFLFFSVPSGILMNKIGRKNVVLLSLIITVISLLLPILNETFSIMVISFILLGIGNALMQTSLNPLVQNVISGGNLAATLNLGQFVKAIASFSAPYLAMWGAMATIPSLGLGWRVLFPIYMIIAIIATLLLLLTPIKEILSTSNNENKEISIIKKFVNCLKLLSRPIVFFSFIGIMCHVGIDVGTNTMAPKLLIERIGLTLNEAAFATSFYFIFRTIGSLSGAFLLRVISNRTFFIISVTLMFISMFGMFFGHNQWLIYMSIALVGFGNANVFTLIFAQALQSVPHKENEVSGLMIMGLFGGAVFPLLMGFVSDILHQAGAVMVMTVGVVYLISYIKFFNNI